MVAPQPAVTAADYVVITREMVRAPRRTASGVG